MPKKPSAAGKTLPKKPKQQANGAPSPTTTPPPAYFLSLTVENVRCFGPKQTLDLSDGNGRHAQWTVILGENGTGKTTLLQCLAELIPQPFKGKTWKPGTKEEITLDQAPALYLKLISSHPDDWFFSRSKLIQATISANITSGSHNGKREPTNDIELGFVHISPDFWSLGFLPSESYQKARNLVCYGYGASRRMREKTPETEKKAEVGNTETLFDTDIGLFNAAAWLLERKLASKLADSEELRKKIESQIETIKALLLGVLPDDIQAIDIPLLTGEKDTPKVLFKTPYGSVSISDLGVGYRTMIAWTVDFARRLFERYPTSPDPLKEPAIVLVDEIDLHLHPSWQRKLIGFLSERFTKTQFIVTAHSPLIVQAAVSANANIAVLRREGDHVVIDQSPPAIRGWRVDQILSSDLFGGISPRGPELDTLLAERKKILSKKRLTQADKKRLEEIRTQYEQLPTGETAEDIKAMDIIHRAAKLLAEGGLASRD